MSESEPLMFGGLGGLYLMAEPGTLVVEVYKRDRHEEGDPTDLRAILLGPDRRPLDEVIIEGDGSARLTTRVERAGVFAVDVTAAFDRYGEHVWWGFTTDCPKYLVETSRGHRDARHIEPIVPGKRGEPFDVCFLPREGEITIEVTGLPTSSDSAPVLHGAADERLATLDVTPEGASSFTIPGLLREPGQPWRLHLPGGAGEIQIDGVTRWERGERFENLSLWSPRRDSFFPLHDLRWVLTPYAHAFHVMPGERREVALRVHSNGARTDRLRLAVAGDAFEVTLSHPEVALGPGGSAEITATAAIPADANLGDTLAVQVAVTSSQHPRFETWSRLEARIGPQASDILDLPIVYRPYEHENAQFGYTPDYPTDNQVYFAPNHTAWTRTDDGLHRWTGEEWERVDTLDGTYYRAVGSKVAFGGDGGICLLAASRAGGAYLYSPDGGATFLVAADGLPPGRPQADIEQFSGHNLPAGPAPFVLARQTGGPDPEHFWRRVNDLDLYLPRLEAGRLVIGEPIRVSRRAIGISSHSGIPSALASSGDRVHVIWGEATDPAAPVPGVPTYVATWDRGEGRWLGEPVLVGHGPPPNDVHNTPSMVIDSEGYLHTLTGAHGQPFAYARSLAPTQGRRRLGAGETQHTAHEGFTEPVPIEEGLRSTYVGLVCGPDDTLHLVFRAWRDDGVYHPHSHYAVLGYKRKSRHGDWEPTRLLAVAPFSEYLIWYHRLTIDRRGRLYVSFDVWSTFWFYRNDHVGGRRKTITSPDGGDSWRLLRSDDLGGQVGRVGGLGPAAGESRGCR